METAIIGDDNTTVIVLDTDLAAKLERFIADQDEANNLPLPLLQLSDDLMDARIKYGWQA